MGLTRRQFLVALSAGLAGGTQLDRIAGLDDGARASSTSLIRQRTPAPTSTAVEPVAAPEAAAAATPTAAPSPVPTGASGEAANKLSSGNITQSTDATVSVRSPSRTADAWPEVSHDELAVTEARAASSAAGDDADTTQNESSSPAAGSASAASRALAGANLEGWRTVLGDSRHTAAGLSTVNDGDIVTEHLGDRSQLIANRHGRGVMAHNTTYLRVVDDAALDIVHEASAHVRTPVTPAQVSGLANGQTVEMALFVWDGKESRRDIGLAMQWVINPWSEHFGALRTWTSSGDQSRWSPDPVAWLDPSDDWQFVEMSLHPARREAAMRINGLEIPAQCTETTKPDNWAYATAAAVSVELISIWPDDRVTAPTTKLECRDWAWDWKTPV